MLRIFFVVVLASVSVLGGCASVPQGPTAEEAARNRARPYQEGLAALDRYRETGECEAAGPVLAKITELEEDARDWTSLSSVGLRRYAAEARERHAALAFAFAEEALNRGCLDDADRVYRRLIEFYVGAGYSGIRDRARVGVEDVRSARQGLAHATTREDS